MENLEEQLKNLKKISKNLSRISDETKNDLINLIADKIEINRDLILSANSLDLQNAKEKVTPAVYNRLKLDDKKINAMISGLRDLAKLENPVNKKIFIKQLDNDLFLHKVSCPIGVLAVIFEARPDVITQVTGLAVKSSNALILKGGKEVLNTNKRIFELIEDSISSIDDFPNGSIIQIYSRDEVSDLLKMDEYIDLIIPRGGNNLVKYIKENTKIPVLGHADGVCHIFVDEFADFDMSKDVIVDAKTQYPSACNSVETLLIHKEYKKSEELLKFLEKSGISLEFNPENWHNEYSSTSLSVKFVNNIDEAIIHINTYGSGHTDAIMTNDINNAEKFMNEVDSAGVYHNASTRFADGYRYGFGAEVGISTNKIHARGPVGLEGLTIYKYKLYGKGHIVKEYVDGIKSFKHKNIE